MRELFKCINEYPWTAFLLWLGCFILLTVFADLINKIKK